jgi:hypothetical protein
MSHAKQSLEAPAIAAAAERHFAIRANEPRPERAFSIDTCLLSLLITTALEVPEIDAENRPHWECAYVEEITMVDVNGALGLRTYFVTAANCTPHDVLAEMQRLAGWYSELLAPELDLVPIHLEY